MIAFGLGYIVAVAWLNTALWEQRCKNGSGIVMNELKSLKLGFNGLVSSQNEYFCKVMSLSNDLSATPEPPGNSD